MELFKAAHSRIEGQALSDGVSLHVRKATAAGKIKNKEGRIVWVVTIGFVLDNCVLLGRVFILICLPLLR